MDNVQDVESSAPQGQADSTAQMPDVQTDDGSSGSSEPSNETSFDAIAAKKGFKSPDDLAKAYANLESQSTKAQMKASDLEKLMFEKSQAKPQEPAPYSAPQADPQAMDELRRFMQSEAIEPLKREFDQKLQTEVARMELRQVMKDNPDFGKYATDIKDIRQQHPTMSFTDAYKFAKLQKGEFANEMKSEALKTANQQVQKQSQAQVAQSKQVSESKIGAGDILGSAKWTPDKDGKYTDRQRAEIEQVEIELFGRPLAKTHKGI